MKFTTGNSLFLIFTTDYVELQKERAIEAHGGGDEITAQANFGKNWKDFPRSVWLLVRVISVMI